MKVIIMAGAPGSGKTTWLEGLEHQPAILSANDYFVGTDGVYRFNPQELAEAHGFCMRKFLACMHNHAQRGCDVAVDNCNTRLIDLVPYVRIAQAHQVPVEIHACFGQYPSKHGVPADKVRQHRATLIRTLTAECRLSIPNMYDLPDGTVLQASNLRCPVYVHRCEP
jgi:hypothetical protein